jgi:hypothetical protein
MIVGMIKADCSLLFSARDQGGILYSISLSIVAINGASDPIDRPLDAFILEKTSRPTKWR